MPDCELFIRRCFVNDLIMKIYVIGGGSSYNQYIVPSPCVPIIPVVTMVDDECGPRRYVVTVVPRVGGAY